MKKIYFAVGMTVLMFFCGCGGSPEAVGKAMSRKLTAAQLFEVTMQDALAAAPNVGSYHAQRYEEFCRKQGVPLDEPILDLLKKGFSDVQTTVTHKVIQESMDPTRRNEVVYKIEYRIDASKRTPVSYLAVLEFIVYASPRGTGVVKAGGFDELNGNRTVFNNPAQVIVRIGAISRGVDKMLAFIASEMKKQKNKK